MSRILIKLLIKIVISKKISHEIDKFLGIKQKDDAIASIRKITEQRNKESMHKLEKANDYLMYETLAGEGGE